LSEFFFTHTKFTHAPDYQLYYEWVNKTYFRCQLPTVLVGWYKEPSWNKDLIYAVTVTLDGAKFASHILLNPFFKKWTDIIKMNILHEAIHVKMDGRVRHGKKFQREKRRLILAGAFDNHL
jgi:hypothetical protein